jgi:hypothetical protein
MSKTRFGISIDEEIADDIDDITEEVNDNLDLVDVNRSNVTDVILTAFVKSTDDPSSKVRELLIKKKKGNL